MLLEHFLVVLVIGICQDAVRAATKPHIIFILADDLGWNDVGFHGSSQIPTPNIDALAYSGLILNNYYVSSMCTPSRSALMTGKHPIHTGMQHLVLFGSQPRGLPLSEKLLPQYLKELGYRNHIVGKWHLGFYKKEYTPLYRGFESHIGYWTGHHDYNDHTAVEPGKLWGLDMRQGMEPAWNLHGQYSTDIFTNAAEDIITKHNTTQPLFLYIAHAAVHSGNPYNPLPAPDEYVSKFANIENYNRRRFAGVLTKLDESVGRVVQALNSRDMLKDSIIIFSTDNGGAADGYNINAASNWPLRGVKNTLFEGGVRGAGLMWSASISKNQRVARQVMHITDWLPTLYYAAGGDMKNVEHLDGVNVWKALDNDDESPRSSILHNIDHIEDVAALRVGKWKIIKGVNEGGVWSSWYGPSGRTSTYNVSKIVDSPAGMSLRNINRIAEIEKMIDLQKNAEILCPDLSLKYNTTSIPCNPKVTACLFNIEDDPCEKYNLAEMFPEVLQSLAESLLQWNATYVSPANLTFHPKGDPVFWNYTWANFGDYI